MMKKSFCLFLLFISFNSCAHAPASSNPYASFENPDQIQWILNQAEAGATYKGKKVLETSRNMISNKEIIVGGCWDFINEVYNRAGFTNNQREAVFSGRMKGPYADPDNIETGDWLYHINHSYKGSEHSGIFVSWINKEKKEALMISYQGENHAQPARYKKYDLSNVYNITRPR